MSEDLREARVVACLARGEACGPIELRDEVDWNEVYELAERHQVAGLCWLTLRESRELACVSPSARHRFRNSYRQGVLLALMLKAELAALEKAFCEAGIRAMILKGPWLAFACYPSPGARPVGDIDICVREGEFEPVVRALSSMGYFSREPIPRSGAAAIRRAHFGGQLRFDREGFRPVELHFRLVNVGPPRADEAWIWETARVQELEGFEILTPGDEAMTLHLVLHAIQHGFSRLRLLHDLRWQLERARGMDYDRLCHELRKRRLGRSAFFALELARELAGASVDLALLESLRPTRLGQAIFRSVWRLDAVRRLEGVTRARQLEAPLLYLLEMATLRGAAAYTARVASNRLALWIRRHRQQSARSETAGDR